MGTNNPRLIALDRTELDICDSPRVIEFVARLRPDVLINCAALTNVDGCESDQEGAFAINADGPWNLGKACKTCEALLVHLSTDFVFNGQSDRPYRVEEPPNPLSIYGESKWRGELAIRKSGCRHLIVRTSWLFGHHGRNFVEAILKKAEAGEDLRVVNDQVGRPTSTIDLTEGLLRLLESSTEGTFHFANQGQCTSFEFAVKIVSTSEFKVIIEPITSAELVRPAKRPAYSMLDLSAYESKTGHHLRQWTDALRQYLRERKGRRTHELNPSRLQMNSTAKSGVELDRNSTGLFQREN